MGWNLIGFSITAKIASRTERLTTGTNDYQMRMLRLGRVPAGGVTRRGKSRASAPMDEAEADVLAFMSFPRDHRLKIHSINPLERLNGEIKRRTGVVASSPTKMRSRGKKSAAARTERRMGRSARSLHEPGNDRAFER